MNVFSNLKSEYPFLKLFVFGLPTDDNKSVYERAKCTKDVTLFGWQEPSTVSTIIMASDLGCFPGTHSVIWEQFAGLGKPAIYRRWSGMTHIDQGGSCIFIDDTESLEQSIKTLLQNKEYFYKLDRSAKVNGPSYFSFSHIAKRAIEFKEE